MKKLRDGSWYGLKYQLIQYWKRQRLESPDSVDWSLATTQSLHCGLANRRLELLTSDDSVLGSQKAGVQAQRQDPPATVLHQLKTGIVEKARYQVVAFVYSTLRLQVQDHVLWTNLVHGFERYPGPCSPDLCRKGQNLGC